MNTPRPGSRYVALGSSFGAGPGIAPASPDRPRKARQSTANYPHTLARLLGLDLVDVTSSGAKVDHLLDSAQFGQPPQVDALTPETELVTVTVGGNDIGYVQSLTTASLPGWLRRAPGISGRLARETAPAHVSDRRATTADNVARALAAVRVRTPAARVLCVDYLTVVPATYRADLPFDEAAHHALVGLAEDLNGALALACARHDVQLITVSAFSADHHAWSAQPWTSGWTGMRGGGVAPFHPTAAGMTAVAEHVSHCVTSS